MEKQKSNSKSAVQAALESTQILMAQDAVLAMIMVVQSGTTRLVMNEAPAGNKYIMVENNIIPYRMRYNKRMRRAELFRGDLKLYLVSKYVQRYVDELWMQLLQAYSVQETKAKQEDKDAD